MVNFFLDDMESFHSMSLERKVHKSLCEWWSATSAVEVHLFLMRSDHLFSLIWAKILLVACGEIFLDMLKLMLTFFEASLSLKAHKDVTKNDDAASTSKIVISGLLWPFTSCPKRLYPS